MVIHIHPSFLGTNNAQPHHGLLLGLMTFLCSFTCFVSAIISLDENNLTGMEACFVAWLKFNVMHHALHCIHAIKLFHNHIFVLDGFTWMTHTCFGSFLDCEWLVCFVVMMKRMKKGKMRCEGDGWKSESGNTKNTQKPMAQVKTSTPEMMNESA